MQGEPEDQVDYSDGELETMTRDQMDEEYTAKKQT